MLLKTKVWALVFVILAVPVSYFILDNYQENNSIEDLRVANEGLSFLSLTKGKTRVNREINEGNPKILLLHGGGVAGSEIWQDNIDHLNKKQYDLLAYDQYGKGYSDRPEMLYSLENLSQQLEEVLSAANFNKDSFSIVSHSLGGMLAIKYMVNHPQKVNKVILLSPGLLGGFKPNSVLKVPIVSSMLMTYYWYWGFVDGRRKEFYDQERFTQYAALIRPFSKVERFKYVYKRTWLDVLTEDVKTELNMIPEESQKKIVLVFGLNDPYYNSAAIPELKAYLPNAHYIEINNVGHNINFEKPDTINYLIDNFISKNN